jgi:hypothetical protein
MCQLGWLVTLSVFTASPSVAQTTVPDLRGTWKGDSESIVADVGNSHHAGPTQSGPRLSSVSFTLTIGSQDGRRFSGSFASAQSTESIIGVISRSGTVLSVDTDGYALGTLLAPDRLELCYLQLAPNGRVASCTELQKQR